MTRIPRWCGRKFHASKKVHRKKPTWSSTCETIQMCLKCKAIAIHVRDNKRTIYLWVKRAAVKTSAFLNRGFFQVNSNIIHKHIRAEHLFFWDLPSNSCGYYLLFLDLFEFLDFFFLKADKFQPLLNRKRKAHVWGLSLWFFLNIMQNILRNSIKSSLHNFFEFC